MPAAKKPAGARQTPAKKPGPKPKGKSGRGKEYALYTVKEGTHELTLVTTARGANGNVAILNAVKADETLAGIPFVPVLTTTIAKQISAAPKERNPVFEVKRHNAKRPYTRRAGAGKPGPKPKAPANQGSPTAKALSGVKLNKDGTPRKKPGPKGGAKKAPAKKTAAKKTTARKTTAKKPAPPVLPAGTNPFVG